MITKITDRGSESLPYKWQFSLADSGYGKLPYAPLVAGDRLICFTGSQVFALDIYTGVEVRVDNGFPHDLDYSDDPSLPTHSRGTLYFQEGGALVARQLSDGKAPTKVSDGTERWTKTPLSQADSIKASDSIVVVSERSPATSVKGFNALTGEKLWGPVKVSQ